MTNRIFSKFPLPRAGKSMNYIEIREDYVLKTNWHPEANRVFNEVQKN